jgi:hypothetical protein
MCKQDTKNTFTLPAKLFAKINGLQRWNRTIDKKFPF